ncbi:MAG: extracellular solute-binding protein [Planctomycetes bacterium]|nr:extracellular solute-binding protein [Planctomycetota bacterium]
MKAAPTLRVLSLLLCGLLAGCGKQPDLVVYCSLDQEFAEPLIQRFAKESGLDVHVEFDVEAAKTVGLVARIREEGSNPRCDVFWNNEVAHTAALGGDGLLEPYDSPSAQDLPPLFRDPDRCWNGFAARAHILIVNTKLADPATITSMWDFVDPKWSGKVIMAKPLTGTTLTHMAALYLALGEAKADEYVTRIHELSKTGAVDLTNGNAAVARLVGDGKLAVGWTDTDDFAVALERGAPVVAVYPDKEGCGTLLLPNSVAILKGAPHLPAAKRFVDWVLRPEIEKELAFSRSAQIPVRDSVPRPDSMVSPGAFKPMTVDFKKLGAEIEKRADVLKQLFVD